MRRESNDFIFRHRTIKPVVKLVKPNYGSFDNPKPVYDKQAHWDKFMVGIESLRSGRGLFSAG